MTRKIDLGGAPDFYGAASPAVCGLNATVPRVLALFAVLVLPAWSLRSQAVFSSSSVSASSPAQQRQAGTSGDLPCGSATTTAQILDCESSRLDKANSDLNRVYGQLMRVQDAAGKQQLRAAETAWIRFRDANAAFHANEAAGGTLAPVLRVTSEAEATEARVLELQKMLH